MEEKGNWRDRKKVENENENEAGADVEEFVDAEGSTESEN